jgi:hypothetical protein
MYFAIIISPYNSIESSICLGPDFLFVLGILALGTNNGICTGGATTQSHPGINIGTFVPGKKKTQYKYHSTHPALELRKISASFSSSVCVAL